jgi:hypothetical protein
VADGIQSVVNYQAEIPLSREDRDSIQSLAQQIRVPLTFAELFGRDSIQPLAQRLRSPLDFVAELYGRELARLRLRHSCD